MRLTQPLWILNITLPVAALECFAEALGENAAAVSVLALPRQELARIDAIYDHEPTEQQIALRIDILAAACGIERPDFSLAPSPNLDWLKKVAEDFPPLKIARWTVHGALHRDKAPNRLLALQIDATSAFGTGEHPTTRGCLLMLDRFLKAGLRPRRMADIGCGSGVLAMACAKVARNPVVAVDLDPLSIQIAASNARGNGLGGLMRVGHSVGYASAMVRRQAPYDLIMSNIFSRPLCQLAADLRSHLAIGGIAILSGLLTTQAGKVIAVHRMQGLALVGKLTLGEWSVLAFQRGRGA